MALGSVALVGLEGLAGVGLTPPRPHSLWEERALIHLGSSRSISPST